jgi:hypothetical protein
MRGYKSGPGNGRPKSVFHGKNDQDRPGRLVVMKAAVLSAVLLATAFSSQANAQAAVEDPGYCAQYYPSANCQNYGPGNPLYRGGYGGHFATADRPDGYVVTVPVRPHHRRHHHG